jgi:hypothetical protein
MKLITHLHLLLILRMCYALPSFPHMSFHCGVWPQGQLQFFITSYFYILRSVYTQFFSCCLWHAPQTIHWQHLPKDFNKHCSPNLKASHTLLSWNLHKCLDVSCELKWAVSHCTGFEINMTCVFAVGRDESSSEVDTNEDSELSSHSIPSHYQTHTATGWFKHCLSG